jgi:predicted ATPase/DNA-binding SARP family transcriptional activator
MAIRCGGQLLRKMRTRKEQWLLALLVLYGVDSPVDRQWLAGTLWPETTETAALANLRRSLSIVRETMGDQGNRILAPTPRTLAIDLRGATCDVTTFDSAVRRSDEASLLEAVDLYRGPLLVSCQEEWIVPEREVRRNAAIHALERLAALTRERDDIQSAVGHLCRAIELDPLRETSVRALMAALAAQGRHTAAAETFRRFRERLHRDVNANPDPETMRLHKHVLRDGRLRADTTQPEPSRRDASGDMVGPPNDDISAFERKSSVPTPITELVGREAELKSVLGHLRSQRLVTLTGLGGVGKTRLALAAAAEADADRRFPDGVHFFRLAPLIVPDVLAPALTGALLGSRAAEAMKTFVSQDSSEAPLLHALRDRSMLLVWDNCEHLLDETARLARTLLQACPRVHLLLTSRQSLGEPGEVILTVEPLAEGPAAQLFAQRAAAASGGRFSPAPTDATLLEICGFVQGLPLALEMAAAWTNVLSLQDIAARLGDRLRLILPDEPSAARRRGQSQPSRRQTLDTVLEGSFRLLDADEAELLKGLACFSGGWTLHDAARLMEEDPLTTLDALARLLDKSLVHREHPAASTPAGFGGNTGKDPCGIADETDSAAPSARAADRAVDIEHSRYDMLEMVAQYVRDRARREPETPVLLDLQDRHRDLFLDVVEQAKPHLAGGPQQTFWFDRIDADYNNIRGALLHCRERIGVGVADAAGKGLRIAAALGPYWRLRGLLAEGSRWLEAMIEVGGLDEPALPQACVEACAIATLRGDIASALRNGEAALRSFERQENPSGQATALGHLGNVQLIRGHPEEATSLVGRALTLQRQTQDHAGEAATLEQLAYVARESGRFAESTTYLTEAVRLYRKLGNQTGEASALGGLGVQFAIQGDDSSAREYLDRALNLYRTMRILAGQSWCLASLAGVERESGNAVGARALLEQALEINEEIENRGGMIWNLTALGEILRRQGDLDAARLTAERALQTAREAGHYNQEPWIYLALSGIARDQGDTGKAVEHGRIALNLGVEFGHQRLQVEVIEAIATIRWVDGRPAEAARLFGAASAERHRQQISLPEAHRDALPGRTGAETAWPDAWAEGIGMSFADAVASAAHFST